MELCGGSSLGWSSGAGVAAPRRPEDQWGSGARKWVRVYGRELGMEWTSFGEGGRDWEKD
ncbi:unnamed protein product [Linum tenue]|uniref:Uncharacterized protein n=1 Tax=Linum tenue TaxID=586396 RepID=A0AAV0I9R1_9ROSI|nr:unnamed protein product [Linum tenue]